MRVTVEKTQETELYRINGVEVPMCVWSGTTEFGQTIQLLVLAIMPAEKENADALQSELGAADGRATHTCRADRVAGTAAF